MKPANFPGAKNYRREQVLKDVDLRIDAIKKGERIERGKLWKVKDDEEVEEIRKRLLEVRDYIKAKLTDRATARGIRTKKNRNQGF